MYSLVFVEPDDVRAIIGCKHIQITVAIHIAERRLWDSIETIEDGFAVFDPSDVMIAANSAYLRVFDGLEDVKPGITYPDIVRLAVEEGLIDIGETTRDAFIDAALARADVGVAMSAAACPLAVDAADVAVLDERVAKLRFPKPAPCGKTPLMASGLSKSYGSLEIFTDVDLAIDRGSRVVSLGLNGAGKTTLLRILAGVDQPDTGQLEPGHGLKIGYYAQEHENLDGNRSVLDNMMSAAPELQEYSNDHI